MCEFACVCVCHVTTLRARYEVVSISRLLQAALFYYHASLRLHECVCVCVPLCLRARSSVCVRARSPYNISHPAPSLLIPRLRFTSLHYICPVILFHPSHARARTCTRAHWQILARARVCVCAAAASQTCATRVWRRQIHINSHPNPRM